MQNRRDFFLDILKYISLIGLLASHVFSNPFILQVRSFDVNLLVIISAILARRSMLNRAGGEIGYMAYLKKRIKRLLLPTWLFISFYLLLNVLFRFQNYSIKQIIRSYLLMNNSIGYVWIIYVYLICAVTVPFLMKVNLNNVKHLCLYCLSWIIYVGLYHVSDNYYFQLLVLYPIVYGLISVIGLNFDNIGKRFWLVTALLLCVLFAIYSYRMFCENGQFVLTGAYKYPPQFYYICYSVGVSLFLLCLRKLVVCLDNYKTGIAKYISFICEHSLWFYLWHILILQIATKIFVNELFSFIFLNVLASIFIFIQEKVVEILEKKKVNKDFLRILRG